MNWSAVVAVLVVAAAWLVRPRRNRIDELRLIVARPTDVIRQLPDTIGLLTVAVHAGLGVEQALRRTHHLLPAPVGPAFASVLAAVDRGHRFGEALDELLRRLGEPARPLVAALAGGQRYGLALLPALDRLAIDASDQRRRQSERAARRLPVLLCFPLALCILPAFVLLTIVPALLGALRALT